MYRFGRFLLCPVRRVLWHDGKPVDIGGRAVDVLIPLVAARGEPVCKDAVMAAAWPGRVVEPNNLTVQIATLRRVLQSLSGDDNGFIRTRSGQGYVFTQPVDCLDDPERPVAPGPGAEPVPDLPTLVEPLTSFVGRTAEVAELTKLLTTKPLITITGLGGVGKTRLALRMGQVLADSYPDGVVFVDLAPLADPLRVADAVAAAVGAGVGVRAATEAALAALRARRALLILDNAEHLRDVVAAMARLILEHCRGVSVLVTSREILGLAGEQVFRLQPLALPSPEEGGRESMTGADALGYDAVRLFADRAAALLPGFVVDDDNAADIVAICHRLDGIALALEMAVPRLEVLTPRQLVQRLQDRFRSLSAGRQDVLPRQRTLRTMFDWSWELLLPAERALIQRLAVFAGSASLGALTRLEGTDETEWDVLDWLTSLAQKSLVLAHAPSGAAEPRYRLLETTRQYALGRLDPDQFVTLRRRHAERMAAIFEQAEAEWPTMHGATWLARYGPDVDNLRIALEWAFQSGGSGGNETNGQGDDALGVRLVAASGSLWWELPSLPLRESHRWHRLAVARMPPDTTLAIQGRVWMGESWKDVRKGDEENHPAASRAVALFREANEPLGLGAALWRAASTVLHHHERAQPLLDESEAILRRLPPTKWQALCLIRQADLAKNSGRQPAALALYDEALALVRAHGHHYGLVLCGGNRAELLYDLGRGREAIEEFRTLRRELPLGARAPVVALMTWHLALAGETAEALDTIREIVVGFPITGLRGALGRALESLALLRARDGDVAAASRLLGCGEAFHPATPPFGPRHPVIRAAKDLITAARGAAPLAAWMAEGAAWSEEDAIAAARVALGLRGPAYG